MTRIVVQVLGAIGVGIGVVIRDALHATAASRGIATQKIHAVLQERNGAQVVVGMDGAQTAADHIAGAG